MKRSWIGAALLVCLLGLGIFSSWKMGDIHEPMAEDVKQASAWAEAGQWNMAENYVNQAKQKWEDHWGFGASFSDHEPMERVNVLFTQLEACGKQREIVSYCLLCAQLQEELEAMGETHRFVWWNLL